MLDYFIKRIHKQKAAKKSKTDYFITDSNKKHKKSNNYPAERNILHRLL